MTKWMILAWRISCINLTLAKINNFLSAFFILTIFFIHVLQKQTLLSHYLCFDSVKCTYLCAWCRIFSLSNYYVDIILGNLQMYLFLLLFQKSSAQHSCILSFTLTSWMKYIITNFVMRIALVEVSKIK